MKTILLNILLLLLNGNIQAYNSNELTYEMLVNRTPDQVIIEQVQGIAIDENGNGIDENGFYISYRFITCEPGEIIKTYFIYNPETTYEDDVLYRIDIKADGNIYIN